MTVSRLDALTALAENATPEWGSACDDLFWQGRGGSYAKDRDADFVAACDPGTVLALVRAVKAAQAYEDAYDLGDWQQEPTREGIELSTALAKFRDAE